MSAPINRTMNAFEWGLLVALSVLWGGSFFFIGIAVAELPPLTIVCIRVTLAAATLVMAIRIMGFALPSGAGVWLAFFGMSLLNNVLPFCLVVWGQTKIASGLASILNATTPLFAVVIAHWLTADEKLTPGRLTGVLIGFGGVAAMIGPSALAGHGGDLLAQLAVLAAAVCYALSGVFGRRFNRMGVAPVVTATGMLIASSVLMLPLSLAVEQPWTLAMPSWPVIASVGGLAIVSTALAYILFFRILATAGATNLMLVTLLIPVSAILLGTLVLGERLGANHFLGMALIALGLAAIDGRLFAWRRGPA